MSKYDDLVTKLKEIFQIDKPELDFGVYRILNARADEINDYLEKRLKANVTESLISAGNAESEQVKKELADAEKNAASLGIAPENVPKVQELRHKLASYGAGNNEHENAVFTHLLTFFSRYYDNGDFISQRRYKGDTYVIPYAGEEVLLHWANKDQYYTKSGENFSNYAFKLDDGRIVRFKLVAADTAKDNRKDNDKERRFAMIAEQTRTLVDDEGDEYEETLLPIAEEANLEANTELVIRFEYKAFPKGTKQETLSSQAVKIILEHDIVKTRWLALSQREPTEKNPTRTLLEKCLTNYTSKNNADYFIHKDLGGFLRRELDFYIKNEVMHLDDVQHAQAFADIEKNLRMIQTLRNIAQDIITFLAQLENFQKKLWLKKKFVVSTNYCITLDLIDEELYSQIADNTKQWEQWQQLGMLKSKMPTGDAAIAHLKSYPYLMVDTALFDEKFKFMLLKQLDSIDEKLDGLLINGDNFQSLNLISETYSGRVDCIHIDPPYNTDTSGFIYKNSYRHSSWLSLMDNRISISQKLMSSSSNYICHIDENEYENLYKLFSTYNMNNSGTIIWDKRNPMNGGSGVALQHEYIIWKSNHQKKLVMPNHSVKRMLEKVASLIKQENGVNDSVRKKYSSWLKDNDELSGGEKAYSYIDTDGNIYQSVSLRAPELRQDPKFHIPLIHPITGKPCQVPPNGFSRTPETLQKMQANGDILFGEDETTQPRQKVRLTEDTSRQLSSMIQDAKKGKSYTTSLGLDFPYCHPVSIYKLLIDVSTEKSSIVLDFFAGSGTSGHATIDLNRDDGFKRKYILVEQGDYFDIATKPRIQKVVYSADWKDGKATAPETGISHAFKVLKIESYEDTLNNLELNLSQAQKDFINQLPEQAKDDYLMRYMLDVESKDSLLSVKNFNKPFDYKLKVAVDSAGAYEEKPVDLVETFNYLIGLHVAQIDYQLAQGFATISGQLPTGEKTLVLWRDTEKVNYEALNKLCDRLAINPADSEYDVVFINGDHNIPTSFTALENEGGITKTLKIRSIEEAFLSAMFDVEDI